MSLSNETPQQFNHPSFTSTGSAVKSKQAERDELARQTNEFLRKKGNRITECDAKGNVIFDPIIDPIVKPVKTTGKRTEPLNSPITLVPYKNRSMRKSRHGQNIRANKDETTFWVDISSVELGRGEGWTKEMAISARDRYREANGLPPVDY